MGFIVPRDPTWLDEWKPKQKVKTIETVDDKTFDELGILLLFYQRLSFYLI